MIETIPAVSYSVDAPSRRAAIPQFAVAAAFIILAARVTALAGLEGNLILDDAFISFRYAKHFASGSGLVFNAGERIEGYTNPLWTVLLAGCARAGLDIVSSSVVLSLLAVAATVVVIGRIGMSVFAEHPHGSLLAGVAPVLFALLGCQSRYVLAGMETPLFVLLLTLGVYASISARPLATGLLFGLATVTRPEGILYFMVVLAFSSAGGAPGRERLRAAARQLAAFAVVMAPFMWWRASYYGSLLPNTYYAKTSGAVTWATAERGWKHLVYAIRQSSLELPLFFALLALTRWRRDRFCLLSGAFVIAAAIDMVAVGGDFQFFFGPRFLMPAIPVLCIAATMGIGVVGDMVRAPRIGGLTRSLLIAALAVNAFWFSWPGRDRTLGFISHINRGWTELGLWLKANTEPDAVIAVGAVGRIPYYSDRYTIDMLGLTDAHIAHVDVPLGAGMPGHEKYDTAYVLDRKPDYIIFVLLTSRGEPAVQDWSQVAGDFQAQYEMIAAVKASAYPGPWVLETSAWSPDLARRGYLAAVYRRTAGASRPH